MTAVQANGITIEYETFGAPDAPPILLVMGLGMQLVAWPDSLCEGLAARGFRVVRFDNRDVGLSTRMPATSRLANTGMLARALIAPQELPVGVLTAVLGGGYLLWLMHRSTRTTAGDVA